MITSSLKFQSPSMALLNHASSGVPMWRDAITRIASVAKLTGAAAAIPLRMRHRSGCGPTEAKQVEVVAIAIA